MDMEVETPSIRAGLEARHAELQRQVMVNQQQLALFAAGDPSVPDIQHMCELLLREIESLETQLRDLDSGERACDSSDGPDPRGAATPTNGGTPEAPRRPIPEIVLHEVNMRDPGEDIQNIATFRLPRRYTVPARLGAGGFGMVISATDTARPPTAARVAIKKIVWPWRNSAAHGKILAKRAYRELAIMNYMRRSWPGAPHPDPETGRPAQHDNIVAMLDAWIDAADLYICMEHCGDSLATVMQHHDRPMVADLSIEHVVYIGYQLLLALKYLHSAGIIHRDLKPQNIACSGNVELKVLDFGLSRLSSQEANMTGYVATRHYRAPEAILDPAHYGRPLDMWSFGCIMSELLLAPDFKPPKDYAMLPLGHAQAAEQIVANRPTVLTTASGFDQDFDAECCPFWIGQRLYVHASINGQPAAEVDGPGNPPRPFQVASLYQDPKTRKLVITLNYRLARTAGVASVTVHTTRNSIMFEGHDRIHQLQEIARVLGKPTEAYILELERDETRKQHHMCGLEVPNPRGAPTPLAECHCGQPNQDHWVRKLPDTVRKPFRELTRFAVAQPPGYEAVGGRIGIEHLMAVVDPVLQQISGLEEEQRHFAEGTADSEALQATIDALKPGIAPYQYQSGVDLLERMLLYPPVERLSAEQALEHPLFAYFREIDEEPRVRADVPFDASFEMYDLGVDEWMDQCEAVIIDFKLPL